MKRVQVVTDSTADIPAQWAAELNITVVPCLIYDGAEVFRDRIDISPEAFFQRLATSPELPRTSQPPIRDFVQTYQDILRRDGGTGIVSIHVPGRFSGTVNAAWAAAQEMADPSRIEIVDSGTVSMGMGWIVVEAARLAQTGASLEEVSQAARSLLHRSKTAAMIDTLDNLYRGGRISQVSALLGSALQIKPLISLEGGEATVWGKVRTRKRALRRLAEEVQSWGPLAEMAVLHIAAEELARELAALLGDRVPAERLLFQAAGPALATHLGLGAVGVCGLRAAEGRNSDHVQA